MCYSPADPTQAVYKQPRWPHTSRMDGQRATIHLAITSQSTLGSMYLDAASGILAMMTGQPAQRECANARSPHHEEAFPHAAERYCIFFR